MTVRSWLSLIAQKYGTRVKKPLREDWPNSGKRKPDWRSRRSAAAKKGTHGHTGTLLTQNEASRP